MDSPGITDLSGWLPKPAGKFGPVHVGPDGHLYTGDHRLRLNGVDLAFSAAFPSHAQAEKVAARLAKFGNNIVRFHIMDRQRFPNGLLARNASDTRTFDPEALDRLDYFTAQLIQRGVYIYLCTLNYRPINAADGLLPEIEQLGAPYQGRHVVGFFDPAALELQKEYDRDLLRHRNAYTRSKAVVGYGGGHRFELSGLVIEPGQTRQDGWSALTLTAIEGDLATASSRWLVTATGYVENTDMGWKDAEHTSVGDHWGQAPTLVEGIPARLTVPFPPDRVEVWALDERGQRRATVPCQSDQGDHAVIAIGPEWKTPWDEVAVQR
jgi:hypothetical protein